MESVIYGLLLYSVIFIIAAAVQFFISAKLPRLRFLPIGAAACGLVFCAVLILPHRLKSDPLFENRFFSLFLATVLLTCAVGFLAGWLVSGVIKKKKLADG